jgi:hypothetical protein
MFLALGYDAGLFSEIVAETSALGDIKCDWG